MDLNDLSDAVIDAALEVHRELGPGQLEDLYEEALAIALQQRQIPFERQKDIHVNYKGRKIGGSRLDLLVDDRLIIELKAVEELTPVHTTQVISHLKATGCPLGLLINFHAKVLKHGIKRITL